VDHHQPKQHEKWIGSTIKDSISRFKNIEAAILEAKEQVITPSHETNKDSCIAVPRPIDVLMAIILSHTQATRVTASDR
jgi:hypothetical protein